MKLSLRHSRPARTATIAIASAAAGMALAVPGLAVATHGSQSVPAPPANPTSANQIQNIDQVKTAIKAYYGDTLTTVNDPVPDGRMPPSWETGDHAAPPVQPGRRLRARGRGDRGQRRQVPGSTTTRSTRRQGDPVRHRRHDAEHLQLRDLQQLRLQPDDERLLRQRRLGRASSRRSRAWSTSRRRRSPTATRCSS